MENSRFGALVNTFNEVEQEQQNKQSEKDKRILEKKRIKLEQQRIKDIGEELYHNEYKRIIEKFFNEFAEYLGMSDKVGEDITLGIVDEDVHHLSQNFFITIKIKGEEFYTGRGSIALYQSDNWVRNSDFPFMELFDEENEDNVSELIEKIENINEGAVLDELHWSIIVNAKLENKLDVLQQKNEIRDRELGKGYFTLARTHKDTQFKMEYANCQQLFELLFTDLQEQIKERAEEAERKNKFQREALDVLGLVVGNMLK